MTKPLIYLASPYTHKSQRVQEERHRVACWAAAWFMKRDNVVFSPIAHSHHIARYGLTQDHDFWMAQDQVFLAAAAEVWVLCLDGWRESKGIKAELKMAKRMKKPVRYYEVEMQPTCLLRMDERMAP